MKTLKNLVNTEKLKIEELMMVKGAAESGDTGCRSNACKYLACQSYACSGKSCESAACNSWSCDSNTCTQAGCSSYMDVVIKRSPDLE